MKNTFSCLLAIVCSFLYAFGQQAPAPVNLSIGERIPDLTIRNLLNFSSATARLSDFKDQLLILDFMNSYCSSCMVNLVHMDSLQAKYAGRVQLFSVTYEQQARMQASLQKPIKGKKIQLAFITQDTVLKSWFPHKYVSHMVWIYKGVVKAITKPEYVNTQNIDALLRNETVRLPVKKDIGRYDPSIPMLVANPETINPENLGAFDYYTAFPIFLPGFAAGYFRNDDSARGITRITYINQSLLQLFLHALNRRLNYPSSCIVLNVKDSSRLLYPHQGYYSEWLMKNSHGYQSSQPLSWPDSVRKQKMLSDLQQFLGFSGRLEKRMVRCRILIKDSSVITQAEKPAGRPIQLSGVAIAKNGMYGNLPYVDEVPGSNKIFIPLPDDIVGTADLLPWLRPYGYTLIEGERELEQFIVADITDLSQQTGPPEKENGPAMMQVLCSLRI